MSGMTRPVFRPRYWQTMSRDRRGSTHRGRPSVVADQNYEPPPDVIETHDSLAIAFSGEDGRSAVFSMAGLPLPLWHPALCEAFARRVGPAGSRRTMSLTLRRCYPTESTARAGSNRRPGLRITPR